LAPARVPLAPHLANRGKGAFGHLYAGNYWGDGVKQYAIVDHVVQPAITGMITTAGSPIAVSGSNLYAFGGDGSVAQIVTYSLPDLTLQSTLDLPTLAFNQF